MGVKPNSTKSSLRKSGVVFAHLSGPVCVLKMSSGYFESGHRIKCGVMLVASKMSAATALTAGILGLTIDVVADGDDVCEIVFGRAVPSFSREENRSVFYDALSF